VDDFSRYTWLLPLKHKSDALEQFVKFKCLTENLFSQKIKQFQTDGGGEYTSSAFSKFLVDHGIFHRTICPHTSQQNGIAERKHRHIIEIGLSLLAQSHLPPKFWVDTCHTAVYLIHRMPTNTLQHSSPFLKLFNNAFSLDIVQTKRATDAWILFPIEYISPDKLFFMSRIFQHKIRPISLPLQKTLFIH
jgi:transposase InsO family protein